MDGLSQLIRNLGPARLAAMGAVLVGLVLFFTFLSSRLSTAPMSILFTDLEMADAAEITDQLRTMKVPFKLGADGRSIMAPTPQLAELRMQFAADGIGGSLGYEILDRQDPLGSTSEQQRVTFKRAMEGELARTIQSINNVRDARVHLVMPERALFASEETPASASVILRTKGGRIGQGQVRSIRQLIAAAVPKMAPERISIVDQFGTLLARMDAGDDSATLSQMHERQIGIQSNLEREIENLLERTVGPGRVRAQVAVELDHERVSQQSEIYDPNQQVVVSTSLTERSSSEADNEGGTVSVAENLPDAQTENGLTTNANSNETQETTNYQNSRTQTTKVREIGAVKRISAAIIVDGLYTTLDDGTQSYSARGEAEIEQITRLVKSAIGYDEGRGDSVEVASMQFSTAEDIGALPEVKTFFGIDVKALERTAEIAVLGVVSILVLLLVVRPIVKKVIEAAPVQPDPQVAAIGAQSQAQLPPPDQPSDITPELLARAAEGDEEAIDVINAARVEGTQLMAGPGIDAEIDVAQVEGRLKTSALKKVGGIIQQNPDESAAIVRQWLHGT